MPFQLTKKACTAAKVLNPKVVIIGAGSSGIAAAVKLLEYGFDDIIVLEAEQRVGGRIHTIPFADNVVDLGAQWCHGERNNVVYELAREQHLFGSTMEIYNNATYIRSNGEHLPENVEQSLSTILEEINTKRLNVSIPINISAHDYLKTEFCKALARPEYQHIDKRCAAEFLNSCEREECSADSSDDLNVLPAKGDTVYEECEGNQALNWKYKGYKTILEILMKTNELGKEYGVLQDNIKLSKKVENIDWKRNDNKVLIHCEDGEQVLADHVIVTISLGVLKSTHSTLFKPELPVEKLAAIKEIDFGSVSKIFLEFEKPFWPKYWTGFTILWTEEDLKSLRGTEKFWWEGISGFYAVDYQPRVLEVWLVGPSARHMETLKESVIRDTCVEVLKRCLKWNIPKPTNLTHTKWFTNTNFGGTYSYHSIKMLESSVTTRDLEKPLTVSMTDCVNGSKGIETKCDKPVVQFAGEATSVRHYSTVHGAIESGWREAKRLAEFYAVV